MSLTITSASRVDTVSSPSTLAFRCEGEESDDDELVSDDLDVADDGSSFLAVRSQSFCIASIPSLVSSLCCAGNDFDAEDDGLSLVSLSGFVFVDSLA